MKPCPACGHPVALRVGLKIRCGNPACRRYDERLAGADADRPAIADGGEREKIARALTAPHWVLWVSGLLFLILPAATLYARFMEGWPAGWWHSLLPTLPFAVIGILILFSGSAGRRIAEGSKAQARLRGDTNQGCAFGLVAGIAAFALFSLVIGPVVSRFRRELLGIPLQHWPLIALAGIGAAATLWGLGRARRIRKDSGGSE